MKKIIFIALIMGVSSLLAQAKLQTIQQKQIKAPDEIEILVNNFLSDKNVQREKQNFTTKKFFVQMFAYSKIAPADLIRKIRQKGYSTQTQEARRNGKRVNLLLVGPYGSRSEVTRYLADLKSISQGAFISKVQ